MEAERYLRSPRLDRVVRPPVVLPAKRSTVVRFIEKVSVQPGGCWLWTGGVDKGTGYGWFRHRETNYAHRASYLLFVGALDPDQSVDHLCCVKSCVNPDHLEAVTITENLRRAAGRWTECDRLHPDTPTRIKTKASGRVHCAECHRLREKARRDRARERSWT